MDSNGSMIGDYVNTLCDSVASEYAIDREYYLNQNVKLGLRNADGTGVMAGVTKIGSVQGYVLQDGFRLPIPGKLYYRGIDIESIVEAHRQSGGFGYEEVAYLLLFGRLPTADQMEMFNTIIGKNRTLPAGFFEDMILKAPSRNIMNKLARSVLALYSYDENPDDTSIENVMRQSIELVARFPVIVADAYRVKRHIFDGKSLYVHNPKEQLSLAENFLRMMRSSKSYTDTESHLLDMMLILHAEHGGGNNSAFACRTVSSSGTDTYSAIAAAVGALKGPLHGGANGKVMEMFDALKQNVDDTRDSDRVGAYLDKLLSGEAGDRSGKIYGLGHAVYTLSDPRAELIKKYAQQLAEEAGRTDDFELMGRIERLGIERVMNVKKLSVPICANVDLYSGLVYSMLGIPEELFTPLFAIARIAGWCAHRMEEVITCGRIIRPAYRYGAKLSKYVPIGERREDDGAVYEQARRLWLS